MPAIYPSLSVVVGLYYFWHVFVMFRWLSQNLQLRCFMDVAIIRYAIVVSTFCMFSVVFCVYVVIFCRMTC
jgi:hypothetical protein